MAWFIWLAPFLAILLFLIASFSGGKMRLSGVLCFTFGIVSILFFMGGVREQYGTVAEQYLLAPGAIYEVLLSSPQREDETQFVVARPWRTGWGLRETAKSYRIRPAERVTNGDCFMLQRAKDNYFLNTVECPKFETARSYVPTDNGDE